MKAKTHSILTVVNAHADVERSLRERADVDDDSQLQNDSFEQLPARLPNRIAKFYRNRSDPAQTATGAVSWGILFGSEYIWAPDIGPMLIVCSNRATNSSKTHAGILSGCTLGNCCILQFENQLSTRSYLRIFHGY